MSLLTVFALLFLGASLSNCFEDKSLYVYFLENGYTQFARLVREAKLDSILDGNGPYTVLAPTDAAVSNIDRNLSVALSQNSMLLKTIVQYHILDGFVLIPQFMPGQAKTALNGQPVAVSRVNNTIVLNNASRVLYNDDIILRNGVVHPIDTVLTPPVISTNNLAAELVIRDDIFNEFIFGLLLSNMTDIIERGEYTIFAPTDAGFTQDIRNIFYRDMPNAFHYYSEMMRYHIVPGGRSSHLLKNGEVLYTLHGTPIHISITSNGVFADGIEISVPDIGASNGVIHGIDGLLFPKDLREELQQQQLQMG